MSLFQELAAVHGIAAIEITVPMRPVHDYSALFGMPIAFTSSSDEAVSVPCVIEEDRYTVADGYKITVRSKVPGFGREHFYQSDLESMIERGHASMRVMMHDEVPA